MVIFLHFATLAPKFTSKDRAKYKEIMHTSSMMLMAHMFKTGQQCNITGAKSSPDKNSKLYSRHKLLESLIKPLVAGGSVKLSADSPIAQQLAFKKNLILSLAVRTPWAHLLRSTLKYDLAKPDKLYETYIIEYRFMQTQVYPCTSLCTIHFHTNSEMSLRFKT